MPNAEPNTDRYIALLPHYWGRGATLPEAVAQLRKACRGRESVAKGKRAVVLLPEGATDGHVDDMGMIRWTWAEGADRTGTVENIEVAP